MPEETASRGEASAQTLTSPNDPASVAAAAAQVAGLTFTRAPDFKVCFSDFHRSRVGNGTVNIVFSRTAHAQSLQMLANIIEEHVEVIMSWTQLKMVAENLASAVAAIEAEVGTIPIPRDFQINEAGNRAIVRALGLSLTRQRPTGAGSSD
jgi:hypothetical protein